MTVKRVADAQQDQQAVADLRDAVTDTLAGSAALRYWCTDHILKCFLQARNWNLSNATKMLRATLEWRQSYQPHAITWDDIREEARTKRQFILEPRDKEGRLVIVMRRRLQTSTDWAMGIKFLVYHLEVACRLADEEGTGKLTWLVDFEGSTRANSPPMKVALQTIHLMQNHYPERMGLALCYHAPLFFSCMWKAVRPFMDAVTINKVCFAPDSKAGRQLMAEKFDMSRMEKCLGGTSTWLFDLDEYGGVMQQHDVARAAAIAALERPSTQSMHGSAGTGGQELCCGQGGKAGCCNGSIDVWQPSTQSMHNSAGTGGQEPCCKQGGKAGCCNGIIDVGQPSTQSMHSSAGAGGQEPCCGQGGKAGCCNGSIDVRQPSTQSMHSSAGAGGQEPCCGQGGKAGCCNGSIDVGQHPPYSAGAGPQQQATCCTQAGADVAEQQWRGS